MEKLIWIKQVRGTQQTIPEQKGTLKALGLHGIGTEAWVKDSRSARGMLNAIQHMVKTDLVDASAKKVQKKTDNRGYVLG